MRIYHVPGGQSYAKTRIDTEKGGAVVLQGAEARAAGQAVVFRSVSSLGEQARSPEAQTDTACVRVGSGQRQQVTEVCAPRRGSRRDLPVVRRAPCRGQPITRLTVTSSLLRRLQLWTECG